MSLKCGMNRSCRYNNVFFQYYSKIHFEHMLHFSYLSTKDSEDCKNLQHIYRRCATKVEKYSSENYLKIVTNKMSRNMGLIDVKVKTAFFLIRIEFDHSLKLKRVLLHIARLKPTVLRRPNTLQ